jgi:hypothetical protein
MIEIGLREWLLGIPAIAAALRDANDGDAYRLFPGSLPQAEDTFPQMTLRQIRREQDKAVRASPIPRDRFEVTVWADNGEEAKALVREIATVVGGGWRGVMGTDYVQCLRTEDVADDTAQPAHGEGVATPFSRLDLVVVYDPEPSPLPQV